MSKQRRCNVIDIDIASTLMLRCINVMLLSGCDSCLTLLQMVRGRGKWDGNPRIRNSDRI